MLLDRYLTDMLVVAPGSPSWLWSPLSKGPNEWPALTVTCKRQQVHVYVNVCWTHQGHFVSFNSHSAKVQRRIVDVFMFKCNSVLCRYACMLSRVRVLECAEQAFGCVAACQKTHALAFAQQCAKQVASLDCDMRTRLLCCA